MSRFFATHRIATGIPYARAYVYDRESGRPVVGCKHRHRSKRFEWTPEGRRYVSAGTYAQRCAEKLLRRFLHDVPNAAIRVPNAAEEPRGTA